VQGPGGRTAVAGRSYYSGGRYYARPAWNANRVTVYQRNFYGYPGWRTYGTVYGPVGPLVGLTSVAFLSGALLVGSYAASSHQTVYVYVVSEDGQDVQYKVDEKGNVISKTKVTK
jgi:hypothetical protein